MPKVLQSKWMVVWDEEMGDYTFGWGVLDTVCKSSTPPGLFLAAQAALAMDNHHQYDLVLAENNGAMETRRLHFLFD